MPIVHCTVEHVSLCSYVTICLSRISNWIPRKFPICSTNAWMHMQAMHILIWWWHTKIFQNYLLLNRFRQAIMGTQAASTYHITPVSAISYGEEVMIIVNPRKDYYLTRRETDNFMSPIQETWQSTSAQTVLCFSNYIWDRVYICAPISYMHTIPYFDINIYIMFLFRCIVAVYIIIPEIFDYLFCISLHINSTAWRC